MRSLQPILYAWISPALFVCADLHSMKHLSQHMESCLQENIFVPRVLEKVQYGFYAALESLQTCNASRGTHLHEQNRTSISLTRSYPNSAPKLGKINLSLGEYLPTHHAQQPPNIVYKRHSSLKLILCGNFFKDNQGILYARFCQNQVVQVLNTCSIRILFPPIGQVLLCRLAS